MLRTFVILKQVVSLLWFRLLHSRKSDFDARFATKIRETFEQLGPTFIKLGQVLSMRPDFLPKVYCDEFEKCLDSGPTLPFSKIRKLIENELGDTLEKVFLSFNEKPIAAASLSQVHKAILNSEEVVAVKIIRPKVKKLITGDIRILRQATKIWGNKIGTVGKSYWLELIEQVYEWLSQETDYQKEINNIRLIQKKAKDLKNITFPEIYSDLSTKKILVLEFIEGISLLELIKNYQNGVYPTNFSVEEKVFELFESVINMSLQKGFFHADLHPANIIVRPDGKIVLLDFGLIGYFDKNLRRAILIFLMGAAFADADLTMKGTKMTNDFPENYDEKALYKELSHLCDRYKGALISEMSNGQFLMEGMHICLQHNIKFPWPVFLYARTTLNIDGMILKLNPNYILMNHAQKVFLRIYRENIIEDLYSLPKFIKLFEDTWETIKKSPTTINKVFTSFFEKT